MKLKNIFIELKGMLTGCYNYGKNNKVIFVKNGKEYKRFFMPRGLKVILEDNDGFVRIEEPIKFRDTVIDLEGGSAVFTIKHTSCRIISAWFHVEYNSQIHIGQECHLNTSGLRMIANCSYGKPAKIIMGDNVLAGVNCLIRTSDGHTMINPETKEPLNPAEDVIIEDNVWITSNCTILKGSHISKGSIIGACSLVNKKFDEENVVIAGTPAKIIKHNVTWHVWGYGKYKRFMDKQVKESKNG
jgi:acetyltransferase-like isoleucine patch superfamily enzyme